MPQQHLPAELAGAAVLPTRAARRRGRRSPTSDARPQSDRHEGRGRRWRRVTSRDRRGDRRRDPLRARSSSRCYMLARHACASCARPSHTLREETLALLDDAHDAVARGRDEVDRIDRLVSSAERINDAVDGAQRWPTRRSRRRSSRRWRSVPASHAPRTGLREGDTVAPAPGRSSKGRRTQAGRPTMFKRLFWLVVGFIARARLVVGDRAAAAPCRGALRARRRSSTAGAAPCGPPSTKGRAAMRTREAELKESLARGAGQ